MAYPGEEREGLVRGRPWGVSPGGQGTEPRAEVMCQAWVGPKAMFPGARTVLA